MSNSRIIPPEVILNKIYLINDIKVMLDNDLAELYHVETKRLNEQVKRNNERFPPDFMFQLSSVQWENLKSQNATSSWGGRRTLPFAFTEQGVAMLSSVLHSKVAIQVNIQIIRAFIKMREMLLSHKEMLVELEKIRHELSTNSKDIELIFKYLKQLELAKMADQEQKNRKRIGYKRKDEA